jgi:hypothetical protein
MLTIKSRTSGLSLPIEIIKESRIREFFGLRWVKATYVGSNLNGPKIRIAWFHEHEIEDK